MDSKEGGFGWSRWYPILDRIAEAEPVHFGGHALLRWEELAQKAVHWDEVGRWVGWSFAQKLEHFWMCEWMDDDDDWERVPQLLACS